ncbi:alpha/beta fold hydrolase [Natronoglycomyces albus]|uniref:Alpha/beta hydrolase n=1 Tax=Natronoglycomyces albus TaxID=2811108 RepID=A0A895XSY7_9ACTN|nr:alpha/beta hydrolase [Natronoglycomyces albus]QSB05380.1 alpha/beta hydrolase [Natronoglycomyces albus]
MNSTKTHRLVLVPGFWLGAWAWDEVADALRAAGHAVTTVTLPGLRSASEDHSQVHISDHIDTIVDALRAEAEPALLVLHSGAGFSGYGALNRAPEAVAGVFYVDTGPGDGSPLAPKFSGESYPLPSWEELVEDGNSLDGLDEQALATFRQRALPQPGNVLREGFELTNRERLDVPVTVLCNSMASQSIRQWIEQGQPFVSELGQLTKPITWVDMPTSHWPMWSKPEELTTELIRAASRAAGER